MNELTLFALMQDTIVHLKTGMHINKAYIIAKRRLCELSGQPTNISGKKLLTLIGLTYRDNGKEDVFWKYIDKYEASKYVIS